MRLEKGGGKPPGNPDTRYTEGGMETEGVRRVAEVAAGTGQERLTHAAPG